VPKSSPMQAPAPAVGVPPPRLNDAPVTHLETLRLEELKIVQAKLQLMRRHAVDQLCKLQVCAGFSPFQPSPPLCHVGGVACSVSLSRRFPVSLSFVWTGHRVCVA
jgi:hypothetical protein